MDLSEYICHDNEITFLKTPVYKTDFLIFCVLKLFIQCISRIFFQVKSVDIKSENFDVRSTILNSKVYAMKPQNIQQILI